jgi:alpha-D-ribose 1-methylphosphonate 5-triphosphate synthase subunit PhnG
MTGLSSDPTDARDPTGPIGAPAGPNGAPANLNTSPADPRGAPADPNGALSDSHGAPADSHGAPADSHGALTDSRGAPADPNGARRHWMSVLARAPADAIEAGLNRCGPLPVWTRVRGPEVGLAMLRGRAGGSGAPFNLGEMTVTRCTVQLESGLTGHAYIAGRDERRAELAAVADALLRAEDASAVSVATLIAPLAAAQQAARRDRAERAAATRVDFFAMRTMRS